MKVIYLKTKQFCYIFLFLAVLFRFICAIFNVTVECSKIQHCKWINFGFSIYECFSGDCRNHYEFHICPFCTLFQS